MKNRRGQAELYDPDPLTVILIGLAALNNVNTVMETTDRMRGFWNRRGRRGEDRIHQRLIDLKDNLRRLSSEVAIAAEVFGQSDSATRDIDAQEPVFLTAEGHRRVRDVVDKTLELVRAIHRDLARLEAQLGPVTGQELALGIPNLSTDIASMRQRLQKLRRADGMTVRSAFDELAALTHDALDMVNELDSHFV